MKKLLLFLIYTSTLFAQNEPKLQFAFKQTNTGIGGDITISKSTKDSSGNLYYVGTFSQTADFDPSVNTANLTAIGAKDTFIAKFDANGNYLWAKAIGGSGAAIAGNIAIGGSFFYLTGNYSGTVDFDPSANVANLTSVGDTDIFLARYDLNGFYVLSKRIGGSGADVANDIKFSNNQIVITGYFSGTVDFDPSANKYELISKGYKQCFLAKYSNSLALQWASNNEDRIFSSEGKSIAFDSVGNILVAANQTSCTTQFDYWNGNVSVENISENVTTLTQSQASTNGNCNSLNILNLLNNEPEAANANFSINFQDPNFDGSTGTIYAYSDLTQKIFDGELYSCYFNGSGTFNSLTGLLIMDYYYYGFGQTTGLYRSFRTGTITISLLNSLPIIGDIGNKITTTHLKKYTSYGGLTWSKNIGAVTSSSTENYTKINLDSSNAIFITGKFNSTSDFDPSENVAELYSNYRGSGFMAKYDSNGNYLWANKIGESENSNYYNGINIYDSCLDVSGNIFIIGNYGYPYGNSYFEIDIDPSISGTYTLNSIDGTDFLAKFDSNGNIIFANACHTANKSILVNTNYDIYLSGSFNSYTDLDATASSDYFYSETTNVFFSKYNFNGNYMYSKQLGNISSFNNSNLISTDAQGNVYRVGNLAGSTDLDPSLNTSNISNSSGSSDFYIAKYTSNGSYVWGKTITGVLTKYITGMNTDGNGNTYVIGVFTGIVDFDPSANIAELSASFNEYDMFIAKYDSNGNYQWAKNISGNLFSEVKPVFDTNGNIYFAGSFSTDAIDFDPSPTNSVYLIPVGWNNPFFVKFNPQGNLIWAKSISSQDTNSRSQINEIALKGNYVYLSGELNGTCDFDPTENVAELYSNYGSSGFMAKYDLEGNYIFAHSLEDIDGNGNSFNLGIAVDSNNDIYLTSKFRGTFDFDPSPDTATYVTSQENGSIAISKIAENGRLVWVKTISSNQDMYQYSWPPSRQYKILINSSNQLVLASSFKGVLDFDSSSNDYILTSSIDPSSNPETAGNIFIAKYNMANGDFICANKLEGEYSSFLEDCVLDSNDNILISGLFSGAVDFNFSSNSQMLSSAPNNYDRFFAKYNSTTLGISENIISNSFVIYPNPVSDILHINNSGLNEFHATIFDISGKILNKGTLSNEKGIDVSSYPQGMYFIKVQDLTTRDKKTYQFLKK